MPASCRRLLRGLRLRHGCTGSFRALMRDRELALHGVGADNALARLVRVVR